MKVALDVDGVITEAPVFFAYLTSALRNSGHEVHIISDFDEHFREQRIEELRTYGVEYDHFEITRDKAEYCKSHAIDFALDDDAHRACGDPAFALHEFVAFQQKASDCVTTDRARTSSDVRRPSALGCVRSSEPSYAGSASWMR